MGDIIALAVAGVILMIICLMNDLSKDDPAKPTYLPYRGDKKDKERDITSYLMKIEESKRNIVKYERRIAMLAKGIQGKKTGEKIFMTRDNIRTERRYIEFYLNNIRLIKEGKMPEW